VESARNEFIAKVMEFEQVAKSKVRLVKNSEPNTTTNLPPQPQNSNLPNLQIANSEDSTANNNEPAALVASNVDTQSQSSIPNNDNSSVEQPNELNEPTADSEVRTMSHLLHYETVSPNRQKIPISGSTGVGFAKIAYHLVITLVTCIWYLSFFSCLNSLHPLNTKTASTMRAMRNDAEMLHAHHPHSLC
jgi:hypothetical protein